MPSALEAVKRAAVEAVDAKKPVLVLFGTVISDSPLKIQVEQTVDHFTEITDNHRHPYKGRKKFLVHNKLKAGEQVVLLRIQGGKKFLVVDRLPEGG